MPFSLKIPFLYYTYNYNIKQCDDTFFNSYVEACKNLKDFDGDVEENDHSDDEDSPKKVFRVYSSDGIYYIEIFYYLAHYDEDLDEQEDAWCRIWIGQTNQLTNKYFKRVGEIRLFILRGMEWK